MNTFCAAVALRFWLTRVVAYTGLGRLPPRVTAARCLALQLPARYGSTPLPAYLWFTAYADNVMNATFACWFVDRVAALHSVRSVMPGLPHTAFTVALLQTGYSRLRLCYRRWLRFNHHTYHARQQRVRVICWRGSVVVGRDSGLPPRYVITVRPRYSCPLPLFGLDSHPTHHRLVIQGWAVDCPDTVPHVIDRYIYILIAGPALCHPFTLCRLLIYRLVQRLPA